MTTNITNTDSFIFNRRNAAGESVYFKTTSSQMADYFRDVYSTELDTVIAEIERIEKEYKESDVITINKIAAYADRVSVAADNVFPIIADGYWAYKLDVNSLSTFRYNYNACITGNDLTDPILDDPDEDSCLEKHALKFYEALLDENDVHDLDTAFYALTPDADQKISRVTHLYMSNTPLNTPAYPGKGDIDWETQVVEGDIIQLSATYRTQSGTVVVNDEHYGMFEVVSVTNLPNPHDTQQPFNMIKVNLLGGSNESFIPLTGYQVKVMKSLGTTLGEDFVQKSGDVMTGGLTIDAATIDNPRTFYNKGEAQTYDLTLGAPGVDSTIKTLGDGESELNIGSASLLVTTTDTQNNQVRINDVGVNIFKPAGYNTVVDLTEGRHITHKSYVDTKDATLQDKIDQTNARIDNISELVERQEYEMVFLEDCWTGINTSDREQWVSCTTSRIQSDASYSDKGVVYPKPTFEHKNESTGEITPLEVPNVDGFLVASESVGGLGQYIVEDGDIIELQLVTDEVNTDPQIIRYVAQALDINNGVAASERVLVGSEPMFFINLTADVTYLGPQGYIEGANYIIKQFPKNNGITVEDGDARYLRKEGNEIKVGTLDIKNTKGETAILRFIDTDSNSYLEINGQGDVVFEGSKTNYKSPSGDSDVRNVQVSYEGLDFKSSVGKIKREGVDKITIKGDRTEFHQNLLKDVQTAAENDSEDTVATIGWVKKHLFPQFVPGVGISINRMANDGSDDRVRISVQEPTRMQDLNDVVVPNTLQGGETLTYDGETNQWVITNVGDALRGVSVMGTSEEETRVGGIWTDGSNFFLRIE